MKQFIIILACSLAFIGCEEDINLKTISIPLNQEFGIKETQQGIISFADGSGNIMLSYNSIRFLLYSGTSLYHGLLCPPTLPN